MDDNLADLLKAQRGFIHDIATPLSVICGMVDIVLTQLKADGKVDPKIIERLEKVQTAGLKVNTLLQAHREYLVEKSVGIF